MNRSARARTAQRGDTADLPVFLFSGMAVAYAVQRGTVDRR